jgi:hypothetical protein
MVTAAVCGAAAQDASSLTGLDDVSAPTPAQFLLFSGVDLWRASAAAYGGLIATAPMGASAC